MLDVLASLKTRATVVVLEASRPTRTGRASNEAGHDAANCLDERYLADARRCRGRSTLS